MLRYRAAAWWANVYCPEIALGLITQEEALDIEPVRAVQLEPAESRRGIASAAIPTAPAMPAAEPWLEAGSQSQAGAETQTPGQSSASSELDVRETTAFSAETQNVPSVSGDGPAQSAEVTAVLPPQSPASQSPSAVPAPGPAPKDKQPTLRAKPATRSSQPSPSTPASQPAELLQQAESPPASTAVVASEPVATSPLAEPLLTDPQQEAIPVGAPPNATTPLAANPFEAGLLHIPRIASQQELESAAQRISELVSDREINPGQGQTLYAALSRQRSQLEAQRPVPGALAP